MDLVLSPLFLEAGQERKELPGLYAAPPRKSSRLRANDRVILFLSLAGASPLQHSHQQELLSRLAETYYTSTGSVTFGMKAMAERLNDFLINRNLRQQARQAGGQTVGTLNMAVVHGGSLYIAHGGLTHTYLVTGGRVEHFNDASGVGRSLGLARLVSLRFYQTNFDAGASLLLSADAPASWKDDLLVESAGLDFPALRRRLEDGLIDLQACFVRTSPGKGQVRWEYAAAEAAQTVAPPVPASSSVPPASTTPAPVQPASVAFEPPPQKQSDVAPEPAAAPIQGVYLSGKPLADKAPWDEEFQAAQTSPVKPAVTTQSQPAQTQPVAQVQAQPPLAPQPQLLRLTHRPAAGSPTSTSSSTASDHQEPDDSGAAGSQPQARKPEIRPSPIAAGLARFFSGLITGLRGLGGMLNRAAARALPDQPAEGVQLSPSTMLFIALAVPVVVVAISATIYAQRGLGEMRAQALHTASQFNQQAASRTDPDLRLQDLDQAVVWLDKADTYGSSQEADDLRSQVQTGIDEMNGVTRLDYRPVISTLGENVQITRMVANIDDIYLLDASQGRILRVLRSGKTTYDLDPTFNCLPGKYDDVQVGKLVDIAPVTLDNFAKAAILGMDGHGHLLYCGPSILARAADLQDPDIPWGKPSRIAFYNDVLYVLDPPNNKIYRFIVSKGELNEKPRLYFDTQVPHLNDVVDMGVDQEYLYLLHADGSMTTCNDTGANTTCEDPAVFGDGRAGHDPAPLKFPDAKLSLMQVSQPPDPSLYVLDVDGNSVYHFSLRKLNLLHLYRAPARDGQVPEKSHPSAFVVTSNHRILLVVDSKLYFSPLP